MGEVQLLVWLFGIHLFGLIAVGILLIPALRAGDDPETDQDGGGSDEGWGNRPNVDPSPSRWPGGGIPLPDAEQSKTRFREPGRLADKLGPPQRRPAREPSRTPVRAS
jgi:hypothetical protein